jgi:hypothetical protein
MSSSLVLDQTMGAHSTDPTSGAYEDDLEVIVGPATIPSGLSSPTWSSSSTLSSPRQEHSSTASSIFTVDLTHDQHPRPSIPRRWVSFDDGVQLICGGKIHAPVPRMVTTLDVEELTRRFERV